MSSPLRTSPLKTSTGSSPELSRNGSAWRMAPPVPSGSSSVAMTTSMPRSVSSMNARNTSAR